MFLFQQIEQELISGFQNCTQLESPSPEAAKSLLMIVTTKPDDNFDEFSAQVRKYNKMEPFYFTEPTLFNRFIRVSAQNISNYNRILHRILHVSACPDVRSPFIRRCYALRHCIGRSFKGKKCYRS